MTRGPVAVLTCDPTLLQKFWLYEYAPEAIDTEARRYPSVEAITSGLGGGQVTSLPIPLHCSDARHGHLRDQPHFDGSLVLIVSDGGAA